MEKIALEAALSASLASRKACRADSDDDSDDELWAALVGWTFQELFKGSAMPPTPGYRKIRANMIKHNKLLNVIYIYIYILKQILAPGPILK